MLQLTTKRVYTAHSKFNRHIKNREKSACGAVVTPLEMRITLSQWEELKRKYGSRCLCCGKKADLTIDHIVPLSRGGLSTADNIQPLCQKCNNERKGDKIIDYRRGK